MIFLNNKSPNNQKYTIAVALLVLLAVAFIIYLVAASLPGKEVKVEYRPLNTYDKRIRVVADIDFEPYSFRSGDGTIEGFDVELMNIIADMLELSVDYNLMSWNECIAAASDGSADVIMGVDYSQGKYSFSLSSAKNSDPFVCFGRKNFSSVSHLYGKRLAVLKSAGSTEGFINAYRLWDSTTEYMSYTDALLSVESGESDYAIIRYSVGRRIIAGLGLRGISAVGPTLTENAFCFGVSEGNEELLLQLDNAIDSLMLDGTIDRLADKWLGTYVNVLSLGDVLSHYGVLILSLLLIVLLIIGSASYMLHKRERNAIALENENMRKLKEYNDLIINATESLYDSMYEIDITNNCAGDESARRHFESVGLEKDSSFEQYVQHIAQWTVKEEFREEYINTFDIYNIIKTFNDGGNELTYTSQVTSDRGKTYYWLSISARIYFRQSDSTLRMLALGKNIDKDKRQEQMLLFAASTDSLSGLYNKKSTEALIRNLIEKPNDTSQSHALLIIDIDYFKDVNDAFGHAYGDNVLRAISEIIVGHFRSSDIVGRFGGDEFVVMVTGVPGKQWLKRKVYELNLKLSNELREDGQVSNISASIGIAVYPENANTYEELFEKADQALYETKRNGRNGYTIFREQDDNDAEKEQNS